MFMLDPFWASLLPDIFALTALVTASDHGLMGLAVGDQP